MFKVGRPIRPMFGHIIRGGRATQFTVGEVHKRSDGLWQKDGLVQIIVKGEYHFERGDMLTVNHVNAWKCCTAASGKDYFTIYADDITYTPKAEWEKRQDPTLQKISDDLPDDL